MTLERLNALKGVAENRDPEKQSAIDQMAHLYTSAGLKDLESESKTPVATKAVELQRAGIESPKVYPEISLKVITVEIEIQAGRYLKLGFHKYKDVKMSAGKFKDLIMKLVIPQPENFRGRTDTPVIVSGQIPAKDQCKLAGIGYWLGGLTVSDWPNDPQHYKTPNGFYMTWVDEGRRFMNRKVQDVRGELAPDERGGTEFDGVALYITKPNILQTRFLDLPGTSVESGSAAGLRLWDGQPEMLSYFVDGANPGFGSLVCGRQK